MKKILLMAAFAVASLTANAQYYVGGTLGFSNDKTNNGNTKVTSYTVMPEFGTVLNDKFGVGVVLGATSETTKVTGRDDVTLTKWGINPYLRYQALEIGKVNVFVDGGVYFESRTQKNYKAGIGLGLNVAPGIAYKLTDNISIVAKANNLLNFGYKKDPIADIPNAGDADTHVNAGLNTLNNFTAANLSFGFYYNF
ncbi:MAG: outer membrane beta-barrel protein [Bacteroidaceae bacterium]|nr:outer membrane beta-barrel protein [Bacteroidaceae bacterium]